MQTGSQASQGFDGQVCRGFEGKNRKIALARSHGVGRNIAVDRRENRQAQVFQIGGLLNALVHPSADKNQSDPGKSAQNQAQRKQHGCARRDGPGARRRDIDDAHVADGAGAQHFHFLRARQKFGVDLLRQLDIACQVQDLALGFRQFAHLTAQLRQPLFQPLPFFGDLPDGRVRRGVAVGQFRLAALQVGNLGFDAGDLFQNCLGLQGQIDGRR